MGGIYNGGKDTDEQEHRQSSLKQPCRWPCNKSLHSHAVKGS